MCKVLNSLYCSIFLLNAVLAVWLHCLSSTLASIVSQGFWLGVILEIFVNVYDVVTEFDVGVYFSRAWCLNSNSPAFNVVHPLAYYLAL